jgi:FkbM family methyltransferase
MNNYIKRVHRRLFPDYEEKLRILADIRGEIPEEVFKRFGKKGLKRCPEQFNKHIRNLMKVEFADAGVSGGLPFVVLPNGRVFYGHFSKPNHRRMYEFLRDLIPSKLNEDTFLLGIDITHRYLSNHTWFPSELLPGRGGVIVEVGAYLGHKSIRFIDDVVSTNGRVLAVEMMPDNLEILSKNVKENDLSDCVHIVESGVWNAPGYVTVKGKGRQRNSLVNLEKINVELDIKVKTETLDTILSQWGVFPIDFLMITVNGAEIEVLEGLGKMLDDIKIIFVACPYSTRNDISNYHSCKKFLEENGCHILDQSSSRRIYAVTARYEKEFLKK